MNKNVRIIAMLIPMLFWIVSSGQLNAQTINTFAGTGLTTPFNDNIAALSANINSPRDLLIDAAGNIIFCDINNFRIRKINTSGIISTIAGDGTNASTGDGGLATSASLLSPIGVGMDAAGNLYICETYKIRKVNTSGIISTIAGTGTSGFAGDGDSAVNATLNNVRGIVVDSVGVIYFTDGINDRIRKIDLNGIITTYAGGGASLIDNTLATNSAVNNPVGIKIYGTDIYVAENSSHRIRKIDNSGIITTYAGTGLTSFNSDNIPATTANLANPARFSFDGDGNLYIGCQGYFRIRKVDRTTGLITTVAGTGTSGFTGDGGASTLADIGTPAGMASDALGNFYYSDITYNRLRKICLGVASASTPTLSATSTSVCTGSNTTLSIASGNLNGATTWEWYNGSCGGMAIGTGTSVIVSPTVSTTYYARGTGGCVAAGDCANIHISVVAPPVVHLGAPDDSAFCPGTTLPLRVFIDTAQMTMNNSGQAGGTPLSCHCPPGYVAVGFNGRTGSWLDKIQLACRKLNSNGTLDSAVVYSSTMGGNGGSPNGPYLLSGDTVLVGADLYKNSNYLTWIKGYGQPISHVMSNGNNNSSPVAMATMGTGTPSSFFTQQLAANGNVVVGLKGWVNGFVPGLSLITMPINKVAGNSYLWSNSSTDSIIQVTTPGTYSVTVTNAGGCASSASIQMIQRVSAAFSSCPTNMVEYIVNGCSKEVSFTPVVVGTLPITQSYILTGATIRSGSGTGSGLTLNKGVTNVKLYVSNICGIDSCQFTVTILDSIRPIISCNTDVVQNQDAGSCGAVVNYTFPTATDNCMGDVGNLLEQVLSRFNTNSTLIVSAIPNKYNFNLDAGLNGTSISDGGNDMYDGGNTLNTNFASNIPYSDNMVINSTSFGATGRYVTRYSSGLFMLAADLDNVNIFAINGNLGADGSGSVGTHQFNLMSNGTNYKIFSKRVYGAGDPSVNHVFIFPDNPAVSRTFSTSTDNDMDQLSDLFATQRIYYLLYAGAGGFNIDSLATVGIVQAFLDNATGPLVSSVTITQASGLASGSVFPVGITNNIFVASDGDGNTDTCSFTVTVLDNTNPTISCPLNIVQNNDAGSCSAIVNYTAPVGIDNCSGATTALVAGLPSGSSFPIGTTTNKFIVTDASGNKDSCSFNVVVLDNEIPVLTNPGDQALNVNTNSCTALYTISDPISDNCTGSSWRYTLTGATVAIGVYLADGMDASNITFNKGATNVTLEGIDGASLNAIPVNFTVTVTDNQPPDITCAAPVTLNAANGLCTATTVLTAPIVSDNCETNGNALNFDGSSDRVPLSTGITLSGPFTIEAWVKPILKTSFSTILGNKVGGFGSSGFAFAINNFQQSNGKLIFETKNNVIESASSIINWGAWQHISISYDGSLVNMYMNGISIPLVDPTAINLVASGNPIVIGDFYQFVLGGKFFGTMDELRIWNVARTQAEISGNMNNELNAQPGLLAAYHFNQGIPGDNNAGITTLLDASGNENTGTLSTFALNGTTSNWIGGLINGLPSITNNAPSTFPVGNTNVVWTATDANNNTATCTQLVTVLDQQLPTISCPINVVASNDAGLCSAVVNYITPIGADNCSGVTTIQTEGLPSGSVFPVGVTTNKFIVTDASGNKDSCSFTVTVNDTELPTITCPSPMAVNNDPNLCSAVVNYAILIADNCPGVSIIQTQGLASGSTFPIGVTLNKFIVTDGSGNKDSCTFTVTVNDTQAPTIACPSNDTIELSNTCETALGDYSTTSSVTLTALINSGNSSTTCTDGFPGGAPEPQWQVSVAGQSLVTYPQSGICFNNTPNLQYSQQYNCEQTYPDSIEVCFIAFEDDGTACIPARSCLVQKCQYYPTPQPGTSATYTLSIPNTGNASWGSVSFTLQATGVFGACPPVVSDNCGTVTITQSPVAGTVLGVGDHTITLFATDASNNVSSCTHIISVVDHLVPTIACPSPISVNNDAGICGAVVNYTAPVGLDNCASTTIQASGLASGSTFPVGLTINKFMVTDASGNKDSCSFTVTVTAAEIDLKGNSISIVDGDNSPSVTDHTDFGDVTVGQTSTRTFTIKNNGTANLTLASGAIAISGTNAVLFSFSGITLPASIAPNDSLNFNVTFNASSIGIKNATINITSNDCDETAYDFAIKGNGDCLPVTIACPSNQTVTTAQSACNAIVNYSSNASGIPSPTFSYKFTGATNGTGAGQGSGSVFNIGLTHVTIYASNSCSLDSCTFDITVLSGTNANSNYVTCDSYSWANNTTYTTSGTYVATFINANGCDSVHTLHLTIHYSNHISASITNFGCYTWPVNNQTYTASGTYQASFQNQFGCDSVYTLSLVITPGVKLSAKAMLDGPFNASTQLMNDSLRVLNLITLTEPYTAAPFNKPAIGGASGETVSSAVLGISGNDAIVDWVYLELREALNPSNIVASKRALIQRDGDIVSHLDGTSAVLFETTYNGQYFVTIKHRNHLGIMSASALNLQGCSSTFIDFTNANPVHTMSSISNTPRKLNGTIYTMWSADVNNNKNVKYNGLSNDKDKVLNAVGVGTPNNSVNGVYRMEDANMDGKIRYNNTDNERMIIINNVGVNTPNVILSQHTPN